MAEIISFGQYESKTNVLKLIWMEIASLSLFTKLTILFVILLPLVVLKSSGQILQKNNYASSPTQNVESALPANCHLAVDFTECSNKSFCQPDPKIVCDNQK